MSILNENEIQRYTSNHKTIDDETKSLPRRTLALKHLCGEQIEKEEQ